MTVAPLRRTAGLRTRSLRVPVENQRRADHSSNDHSKVFGHTYGHWHDAADAVQERYREYPLRNPAIGEQQQADREHGQRTWGHAERWRPRVSVADQIAPQRIADHGESDADVKAKASAALAVGLGVILCVGESEAERDAGKAEAVVAAQLAGSLPDGAEAAEKVTVAYEPVWAIGTGRTASVEDIAAMHRAIRAKLVEIYGEGGAEIRILYGGSVKAENAAEILATEEVGGALVGGASLTAESFLGIIVAAAELGEN